MSKMNWCLGCPKSQRLVVRLFFPALGPDHLKFFPTVGLFMVYSQWATSSAKGYPSKLNPIDVFFFEFAGLSSRSSKSQWISAPRLTSARPVFAAARCAAAPSAGPSFQHQCRGFDCFPSAPEVERTTMGGWRGFNLSCEDVAPNLWIRFYLDEWMNMDEWMMNGQVWFSTSLHCLHFTERQSPKVWWFRGNAGWCWNRPHTLGR